MSTILLVLIIIAGVSFGIATAADLVERSREDQ